MKTANTKSTFPFSVSILMPRLPFITARKEGEAEEDHKTRDVDLRKRSAEAAALPDGEAKDAAVASVHQEMVPEIVQRLAEYGAKLQEDRVPLTVSLGSLFFDLYEISAPQPAEAPLAQMIHKKRRDELATRLESEEFELSRQEINTIRPGLEDPKVWETVKLSAYYMIGEEKRYVSLNNKAAPFFGSVVNAAVDYVLANEK